MQGLAKTRGLPGTIVVDNGPEFAGRVLDPWAYEQGVHLHFIDPGKPMQNAYVESLNGKFRDECLNEHWFLDLNDARRTIETYWGAGQQQGASEVPSNHAMKMPRGGWWSSE